MGRFSRVCACLDEVHRISIWYRVVEHSHYGKGCMPLSSAQYFFSPYLSNHERERSDGRENVESARNSMFTVGLGAFGSISF